MPVIALLGINLRYMSKSSFLKLICLLLTALMFSSCAQNTTYTDKSSWVFPSYSEEISPLDRLNAQISWDGGFGKPPVSSSLYSTYYMNEACKIIFPNYAREYMQENIYFGENPMPGDIMSYEDCFYFTGLFKAYLQNSKAFVAALKNNRDLAAALDKDNPADPLLIYYSASVYEAAGLSYDKQGLSTALSTAKDSWEKSLQHTGNFVDFYGRLYILMLLEEELGFNIELNNDFLSAHWDAYEETIYADMEKGKLDLVTLFSYAYIAERMGWFPADGKERVSAYLERLRHPQVPGIIQLSTIMWGGDPQAIYLCARICGILDIDFDFSKTLDIFIAHECSDGTFADMSLGGNPHTSLFGLLALKYMDDPDWKEKITTYIDGQTEYREIEGKLRFNPYPSAFPAHFAILRAESGLPDIEGQRESAWRYFLSSMDKCPNSALLLLMALQHADENRPLPAGFAESILEKIGDLENTKSAEATAFRQANPGYRPLFAAIRLWLGEVPSGETVYELAQQYISNSDVPLLGAANAVYACMAHEGSRAKLIEDTKLLDKISGLLPRATNAFGLWGDIAEYEIDRVTRDMETLWAGAYLSSLPELR